MLAIKGDDELNELIKATISEGGVVPDPRVGQALLESKKRADRARALREGAGGMEGNIDNPCKMEPSYIFNYDHGLRE